MSNSSIDGGAIDALRETVAKADAAAKEGFVTLVNQMIKHRMEHEKISPASIFEASLILPFRNSPTSDSARFLAAPLVNEREKRMSGLTHRLERVQEMLHNMNSEEIYDIINKLRKGRTLDFVLERLEERNKKENLFTPPRKSSGPEPKTEPSISRRYVLDKDVPEENPSNQDKEEKYRSFS